MSDINEAKLAVELSRNGQRLLSAGDFSKAIELLKEASRIFGQVGDFQSRASHQLQIADIYLLMKHPQEALENYQIALASLEKLEDEEKQAKVLNNIGLIEAGMGRNDSALDHFRRALELYQHLDSTLDIARQWGNLGTTYRNMQDWEEAMDAYNQALSLYQKLNHTPGIADQFTNMAYVYSMRHELAQALEFYKKSLPLYTEAGDSRKVDLTGKNIMTLHSTLEEEKP